MACTPITFEEILETLSPEEREEVLRPDFKVPLQHYLTGFNRNPLVPREAVLEKTRIVAQRRITVKKTVAENPDIQNVKIDPVIIIGMPRSGTTVFHRMVTSDPQFLSPMLWEMVEPLPPGRPENWRDSDRFKRASENKEMAPLVSGYFDQAHFVRMEAPEECFHILRNYFMDFVDPTSNPDMKEFRQFIYNMPEEFVTNAYEFHKMCLQCIFYGNLTKDKTVVLKSPIHCLYPEIIRKVYPSAKFVFPYRNPKVAITSFAHVFNQLWQLQAGKDDFIGIANRGIELYKLSSERMVRFFKQSPQEIFISIPYSELVAKPLDVMRRMYAHFNLNFSQEAEKDIQKYLQENYQYKYGKLEYTAEQFGITDELIQEEMKVFLEYFGNGPEKLL